MELRVLNYFLTVAREGGLTGASEVLHVTQPTMSRQIQELEEELGQKLFIRTTRSMVLTPEGMLLRKRAEEILEMAERTKAEFSSMGTADVSRYNSLRLPAKDTWGLVLRRDHPLAQKKHIRREDLTGIPLIMSRQDMASQKVGNDYLDWFGKSYESLDIVAGYSLMYNGALMVKSGIGCAVGLDQVINTTETSDLCFRPFDPPLEAGIVVIWKKYQVFSKPAEMLLEKMMGVFGE